MSLYQNMDFTKIGKEKVGYRLRNVILMNRNFGWLEAITFGDFIAPYLHDKKTYRELCVILSEDIKKSLEKQDNYIRMEKTKSIFLDILVEEMLEREALLNSIGLIKTHYLLTPAISEYNPINPIFLDKD